MVLKRIYHRGSWFSSGRLMVLVASVAIAIALVGVLAGSSGAFAGETTIVSVSSSGARADYHKGSYGPSISASGRFVAFQSWAKNLVPGTTGLNLGHPWSTKALYLLDRSCRTSTKRTRRRQD